MVDNILAFARADAQGIELHPTTVDLVDLAMHVRSTMEPIAARKNLAFAVHADADLPLIEADRNLLVRVMENLAMNACKFTPAEGDVVICIASEPLVDGKQANITITVEDTGVGIAPEDLARIFEPYTKGAYREGGSSTGAGLGLAVIRQIADAMHGEVAAEPRAEGGSRFTFSFPATVLDEEEYE
jgi:signal transduction histidine kinase